jgi:hypothetical protein
MEDGTIRFTQETKVRNKAIKIEKDLFDLCD